MKGPQRSSQNRPDQPVSRSSDFSPIDYLATSPVNSSGELQASGHIDLVLPTVEGNFELAPVINPGGASGTFESVPSAGSAQHAGKEGLSTVIPTLEALLSGTNKHALRTAEDKTVHTSDSPKIQDQYDLDALTGADLLRGFEHLSDALAPEASSDKGAKTSAPILDAGRTITVEDIHRWESLSTSEREAAGTIIKWLKENGIQYGERRFLTKKGISNEGYAFIKRHTSDKAPGIPFTKEQIQKWADFSQEERDSYGGWVAYGRSLGVDVGMGSELLTNIGVSVWGRIKLAPAQGSTITYEQIKNWSEMPQAQKEAFGGWRGYAEQHGIALGSAVHMLANTGLRKPGHAKLAQGQGRAMSDDDLTAWRALSHEEKKAAGRLKGWAKREGISLVSAESLISSKGLTHRGEEKVVLSTIEGDAEGRQQSGGMSSSSEKRFAVPTFLEIDPAAVDTLVIKPTEQPQAPYADLPAAHIEEPTEGPLRGQKPNPGEQFSLPSFLELEVAPAAVLAPVITPSAASGSRTPEQLAEAPTKNKGVGTLPSTGAVFNLLSDLRNGPSIFNNADERVMQFAVENNMVDKDRRLTREGMTKLKEMNDERKLLTALREMSDRSAETARMNNKQKNTFTYNISNKTQVDQQVLRRYIFDTQKLDAAIEEITIKWTDQ